MLELLRLYYLLNKEKERGIKIERDFHVGTLRPDGYYRAGNEIIEIKEPYHDSISQQIRDTIRENKIKAILNCSITSINEQQYLKNMKVTKTIYDF